MGRMEFYQGPVALLFTDVEEGVRLWEADRGAMTGASARHNRIVREQIEIRGGHVFKMVGEAFRAAFADPSAALATAVSVQRAIGAEKWPPGSPIRVKMALHSGVCVERDGDYIGPVVNRLALLLSAISRSKYDARFISPDFSSVTDRFLTRRRRPALFSAITI